VTIGAHQYPVTVVRRTATSVELEIGGERAVVENWPEHFADPPGPVDVNGERGAVRLLREAGGPASAPLSTRAGPSSAVAPPSAEAPPATGALAVVPPMPGRVVEVRVAEGDHVQRGDILLVLEAMKMRNELPSPGTGVVRGLRVSAGTNARAKEPMLYIVPD
jgi:glutaconyl-CoA/methylmalonyl-CoA decarboxylase subunit gamma